MSELIFILSVYILLSLVITYLLARFGEGKIPEDTAITVGVFWPILLIASPIILLILTLSYVFEKGVQREQTESKN